MVLIGSRSGSASNFLRRFETSQQKKRRELIEEARTRLRDVDRQLMSSSLEDQLAEREGVATPKTAPRVVPPEGTPFITPVGGGGSLVRNVLEGISIAERDVFTPIATFGTQVSDVATFPGVIIGQAERELEERLGGREAEEFSFTPPTLQHGGFVNPIAAALGSEKEQERAAAVFSELPLPVQIIVRLVFDPLNLVPFVGFTKISQFTKLLRIAIRGGKGAKAAKAALAGHEVVTAARQSIVKEGISTTDRAVAENAFSTIVQEERRLAQQLTPDIARVEFGVPSLAAKESFEGLTKKQLLEEASKRGIKVSPKSKKADIIKALDEAAPTAVDVTPTQLGNLRRVLKDIVQGNPSTDVNAILRSGVEATLKSLKITAEEVLETGKFELLTIPRLTPKAAEVLEMKDLLAGRVRELGGDPSTIANLSDEALEAAATPRVVEPASVPVETKLDDIAQGADTPKGDPGVTAQVADDAGEFAAQTTRSAEEVGTTFVAHMRPLEEMIPEVVTSENRVVRWLVGNTGINASILDSTEVGRVLQAHYRQRLAGEISAEVAVIAASDVHTSTVLGFGRLSKFDIVGKGTIKNLKVAEGQSDFWWEVFSRPGDYKNLSKAQRAQIDDYLQVVKELEDMRVANGLKPRAIKGAEGWFYVPRKVKGVDGIDVTRPTNPGLQRHYEEAREGVISGRVDYEISPRTTLLLHANQAYREVADAQLAAALRPLSVTEKEIMAVLNPELLSRMETVTTRLVSAERELRRIRVPRVAKKGKLTKEEKALRKKFDEQRTAAKEELKKSKAIFAEVGARYRRAKDALREKEILPGKMFGKDMPDNISVGKWRNRFFPREDVKKLQDGLATMGASISQQNVFAKGFNTLGNTVRLTASLLDFALPFIHGLPTLARNPVVWSKATAFHYMAWFDPTIQARFLRSHLDTFQRMAKSGTPIGDPEFFAALKVGEGFSFDALARNIPGGRIAQNIMRQGGKQTAGRFMASYNAGLAANRVFLFEAMEKGWKGTESELWQFIRNMTGGLDTRALGLTPNRRGVESMWVAFSPRLLRSTVALVADLRNGPFTPNGRASWRALGSLASGATGLYVLSGLALGKDWDEITEGLNPLNGKRFLSHEINGQWIGIGGQVRAITQLLAVFGESAAVGGFKFATGDSEGALEEFAPFASADMFENPLLRVWSGRGAVGLGIAAGTIEATTGADTVPFEDIDGLPELALHIGTSALPFTLQARMEGANWTAVAFEAQGLRTSPQTLSEKHDQMFPDSAPFKELIRQNREQIIRDTPELQEIADRLKAEGTAAEFIGNILGVDPKAIGIDTQPTNKSEEIREARSNALVPNAKAVLNGLPGAGEVYDDVRRGEMAKSAGRFEELLGDADFEFKGRDQIIFQQVQQVEFNRDWNDNGIPGDKDDVRLAIAFQDSLKADMSQNAQRAMGNPENTFNDPEVIAVEKIRNSARKNIDIWFDLPKYRLLDVAQSDQVDLLLDRATEIRQLAALVGLTVSRDQVLQVLGALTPGIDMAVLVIARASTFSQFRDFVRNPEQDQFVLAHPEMLSFYPFLFDTLSVEDQLEARRLELLQAAGVPASFTDFAQPPSNFIEALQPRRELPETFLENPLLPD